MTFDEPVAYMWKTVQGTIAGLVPNDNSHSGGRLGIPLYTAEDLHPRVKMTKNQHKQFENYKTNKNSFYHFWQSLLIDDVLFKDISERDLMLAWLDDGAIEIVPNMKWFVRSKTEILYQLLESEKQEYTHSYLIHNSVRHISYEPLFKDELEKAMAFDTEEEAKLWKNPLTEAVQLPVEDE